VVKPCLPDFCTKFFRGEERKNILKKKQNAPSFLLPSSGSALPNRDGLSGFTLRVPPKQVP
jgi:hypothetical protein